MSSRTYYTGHYCKHCGKWVKTTEWYEVFESGYCRRCYYNRDYDDCDCCGEYRKVIKHYKCRKKFCKNCYKEHLYTCK